jgi:hypothetical protein
MFFPFYYTGEVAFYKSKDFNVGLFYNNLKKDAVNSNITSDVLTVFVPYSLTKIPVKVYFSIIDDNVTIYCKYKISLFENNTGLLFSFFLTGFFYYFNSILLSVITLLAGFSFYIFNLTLISRKIKLLIEKTANMDRDAAEPVLWEKQQKWIKTPDVCPACGEKINPYSKKCLNCGLILKGKHSSKKYSNTTVTYKQNINYILTKDSK